jgi:hypothetical protein
VCSIYTSLVVVPNPISTETSEWENTRNALAEKMVHFDPVYKELADEKLLGWQSPAVSALWQSRTRKFKVQSTGNRAADMKRFTPEETKYFKFYKDVLHLYAPDLFQNTGKEELFIDVGSAPGGLSKYLITECGWRGYAFSLSPSEGGLEMRYLNPQKLGFSLANMTRENEWRRMLTLCQKAGFTDVHFVNTGVVVDFGQVESDGGGNAEMSCRSISSSASQLLLVFNTLKKGGSAMWIHSLSHLDTLFFFLKHLVNCFESVRILNTLSPARSPVYVILRGFKKGSQQVADFEQVLMTDNATVTPETIGKWQVHNFSIIESIMNEHVLIRDDIRAIWNQKKESLRETRLFAEKRFRECGNDDNKFTASGAANNCLTLLSGVDQKLSPQIIEEIKSEEAGRRSSFNTAAGVCSISTNEQLSNPTSLLTIPKTFGPPSRR